MGAKESKQLLEHNQYLLSRLNAKKYIYLEAKRNRCYDAKDQFITFGSNTNINKFMLYVTLGILLYM